MLDIKSDFYDKIKIITPKDDKFYFFGYYDLHPTQEGGKKHLSHRTSFMDRLPEADDVCELGYIEDGKFTKFAETTAWNFQQGAMLTYHPTKKNTVFYNTIKDGNFVTAIHNYDSGEIKYAAMPSATYSSDGKYSLSVNFGRIFNFRKGYGYAGAVDKYADVCVPEDDGVFYVDLETGKARLLISYRDLLRESGFKEDERTILLLPLSRSTERRGLYPSLGYPSPMIYLPSGEREQWMSDLSFLKKKLLTGLFSPV